MARLTHADRRGGDGGRGGADLPKVYEAEAAVGQQQHVAGMRVAVERAVHEELPAGVALPHTMRVHIASSH